MTKNILVINDQNSAIEYYRLTMPFAKLAAENPDWNITFLDSFNLKGMIEIGDKTFTALQIVKEYDTIVFSRTVCNKIETELLGIIAMLKSVGIRIIVDIDDYWLLNTDNPTHYSWNKYGMPYRIIQSIQCANHVFCTNPFLASLINQYNKNVTVVPNAIEPTIQQFMPNPTESEFIRFGYAGGAHHQSDVNLMKKSMNLLWNDKSISGLWQIYLCGFSIENTKGNIVNKDGTLTEVDLSYEQLIYPSYERVLTDNYSKLPKEYIMALRELKYFYEGGELEYKKLPYQRIKYKKIDEYATVYNLFDVSLIPLKRSVFASCKSELKLLEAGIMKKAAIVSDTIPYRYLADKYNSIMVKEDKPLGWYNGMKKLINNPNLIADLAEKLHEDVMENYDINDVNQIRKSVL